MSNVTFIVYTLVISRMIKSMKLFFLAFIGVAIFLLIYLSYIETFEILYRKYFTVSVDNSTALLRRVHTSTDAVISVDLLYKSNVIKIGDLDTTNGTEYVGVTGKRTDKVRVLVWVMTSPDSHATKAKAVKETWGKRCHILLFFSSKDDPLLPVIGLNVSEGRDHLSAKTLKAFQYVYKLYFDEADWFMKVDDDTFVIPDNLKYFLSDKNPNEPKYYGHHFKAYIENGYNSGGAGYVLSKEALRRFMENSTLFNGLFEERSAEDLEIGKCMEKLGVEVSDSTDSLGRSRFHCFNPFYHLQGYFPDWYLKMDSHGAQKGISDNPISFHYITPEEMYTLEYFIFHFRLDDGSQNWKIWNQKKSRDRKHFQKINT